jgi:Cu2+-exporting ATPase
VVPVAGRLGIQDFRAGMTPDEKIARIAKLKAQGRRVLMVGDASTTGRRSPLPTCRSRR